MSLIQSAAELELTHIYTTLQAPYPLWGLGPSQSVSPLPPRSRMRSCCCCWNFLVLWLVLVLCFVLLWPQLLWHVQASQDQAVSGPWLGMELQLGCWAAACWGAQFCQQQRAPLLCLLGQQPWEENAGNWQLCHPPQLLSPMGNKGT